MISSALYVGILLAFLLISFCRWYQGRRRLSAMNLEQIERDDSKQGVGSRAVLMNRRVLTCPECSWVHYVMTTAEKVANDVGIERYHLDEVERQVYESAWRQCVRCEAPAREFCATSEGDLAHPGRRALGDAPLRRGRGGNTVTSGLFLLS
jgi:hypothetical protein